MTVGDFWLDLVLLACHLLLSRLLYKQYCYSPLPLEQESQHSKHSWLTSNVLATHCTMQVVTCLPPPTVLTEWYIRSGVNGLFSVCLSSEMFQVSTCCLPSRILKLLFPKIFCHFSDPISTNHRVVKCHFSSL